jgi:hypothetical protein
MRTRLPALLSAAAAGVGVLLTAGAPAAADLEPWSVPYVEPLRMTSLPLAMGDGAALAAGAWEITVTPGYFNLWSGSWHTATIHQELGLVGQPLTRDEVLTLEQRHPGDDIYRFDVEGTLTEVRFACGLGHGLTASLAVPWIEIGQPHWDAISQDVHAALGWGEGSREIFARGQTVAFVWSPRKQRAIEGWDELAGGGVGDISLTLSGSLGELAGGEQRWAVALEPPTGKAGTLTGSGGWDAGLRWFGTWRWARSLLRCAVGWTRLDPAGSFLGAERSDTWHALAEYRHAWGDSADVLAAARADTSPLASFSSGEPGKPSFFFTFGVRQWLGSGAWAAFALGENLIPGGVNPDFTLQLQLGVRGGAGSR